MRRIGMMLAVLVGGAGACGTGAREAPERPGGDLQATAVLMDASGAERGRVHLRQAAPGGVLLDIRASGLQPGTHAVHIHETGSCEAPDFQSAGGHYAPRGHSHGALHRDGMHAGDMVNMHVPENGTIRAERLAPSVSLHPGAIGTLFDDDGSAIVVHAGADDYRSQPSGDAGGRVLCGVIQR